MKRIVRLFRVLFSFVIALCILSVFVLFYDYSGIHISNSSGSTDYKWQSMQYKANMREGYSWLLMDRNGFNNISVPENIDVLIMGSSHMEAVNVNSSDNTASILSNSCKTLTFYNIGMSGHTIYRCANNLNNAVNEFKPQKYVVIETDSINLQDELVKQVLDDELETIPSYDSGLVYYIQQYAPSIKVLFKSLQDWNSISNNNGNEPLNDITYVDYATLDLFLKKMKSECGNCKLVILYHPIMTIDSNGFLIDNADNADMFKQCCLSNDIILLDMTEDFKSLYSKKHILAHGFSNTAIGVGHLNSYGHKLIANRLLSVISEDMNSES